jgi:hypothetical protein
MTTRPAPRKTQDDQPFDFNLDAVAAEVDLTPFRVHFAGRRWELAHLQGLNSWDLVEAAEGGDVQAVVGSLRLGLGDQWDDFRKLPLPQFKLMPLFEAWRKHCGLEPGESPASVDS